ncbi:MAG: aspartate aminotransferase family protein [Candidatus Brocadiae bacterium]|nr:aspartate aminotransferase family protein [Candidatus Brocadiia bacterium]
MTTQETIDVFERYVIANYTRQRIVAVRGEGSYLWDAEGKRYLDLFPGWGVDGIGHCHPRVVEAVREQASKLLHVANVPFYIEQQGRLAQLIVEHSFEGQCFFCNSGAEANEAAIKLARRYAAAQAAEGVSPVRFKVITAYNSFHGRTLTTVAATAQPKYHAGFYPLPPGFVHVPFNDADVVAKVADGETCAVLVEPIQGEGGVNVPDDDYLPKLRQICDERGILLILDEVQTGVGRTGKWFGHQQWGVEPDIMTLAKALGGGMAIGAIEAKPHVAKHLVPGSHASTFGGNPMACAGGIATFEAIEEEGLLANAQRIGEQIKARAAAMARKVGFIREVRGMGCMIGIELGRPGADIVNACTQQGLLINCTHDTVLRMLPSMACTVAEIDEGMDILEGVLTAV